MESAIISLLLPVLFRWAVTAVGGGVAALSAYLAAKYGLDKSTIAGLGGGIVALGTTGVTIAMKNKSASAIINRIPVVDMLHAVANATNADVREIQVGDRNLADAVPSPKVIPAEGHTQASI